jgi:hypothetical protein
VRRWLYTLEDLKTKCVFNEAGCWLWQGHTDTRGYGQVWIAQQFTLLHRWAYEQKNNLKLQSADHCCHRCDTPNCVNPDHIFIGSASDNIRDAVKKGRHSCNKIGPSQVKNIRSRLEQGEKQSQIAKDYGVCASTISDIKTGVTWSYV